MIRTPLSRQACDLIQYISPRGWAFIQRCRSMPFMALNHRGERIVLEYAIRDEFTQRRAERAAKQLCADVQIAGVIALTYSLEGARIVFEAIVLIT